MTARGFCVEECPFHAASVCSAEVDGLSTAERARVGDCWETCPDDIRCGGRLAVNSCTCMAACIVGEGDRVPAAYRDFFACWRHGITTSAACP